uniref:Uncharacterized protein n=1 Tax=Lygus hesperus TaxID=30085 RepID=A0A0A9YPP9_LYGHE
MKLGSRHILFTTAIDILGTSLSDNPKNSPTNDDNSNNHNENCSHNKGPNNETKAMNGVSTCDHAKPSPQSPSPPMHNVSETRVHNITSVTSSPTVDKDTRNLAAQSLPLPSLHHRN